MPIGFSLPPRWFQLSDNLICGADTERSSASTTPVKVKEIRIDTVGMLRIKFDLKSSFTGIVYGQIFKNGSAWGTEQSMNAQTYATFSEDLGPVAMNDLIQLYIWALTGYTAYIQNFRFYELKSLLGDPSDYAIVQN